MINSIELILPSCIEPVQRESDPSDSNRYEMSDLLVKSKFICSLIHEYTIRNPKYMFQVLRNHEFGVPRICSICFTNYEWKLTYRGQYFFHDLDLFYFDRCIILIDRFSCIFFECFPELGSMGGTHGS